MDLYHILSRGVDKRKIFLDEQDYFRFVHNLYEFNDEDRVNTSFWSFKEAIAINDIASRSIRKKRKLLVDIHIFCLMPNHYHLLLSPRVERGISKFMKKLNMGYAKYFNQKYKRSGTLFESRYKSILIKDESHFIHLPYYIHLNPLDLQAPEWRERKIYNYKKAVSFLENYRWSSFLDYIGKKNFPSVTYRNFILKFTGGPKKYYKETLGWIRDMEFGNGDLKEIILE